MGREVVEAGALRRLEWLGGLSNYVLITDEHVAVVRGNLLHQQLQALGLRGMLLVIPPGEGSKTRERKAWLEDQMMAAGCDRETTVLALGGGVVTDLAGFVAATYCRGIPWVAIPTTLLGMIDASVGGKVAVNHPRAKNCFGAFHPPLFTVIDREVLETLPHDEWLNGIAEMIKYALIGHPQLLEKIGAIDEEALQMCCEIKRAIVAQDPFDRGLRRVLNYGHTIGHALETLSAYRLAHGRAIVIGMLAKAHVSWQLGYLRWEEVASLRELFQAQGFCCALPQGMCVEEVVTQMGRDKKAMGGMPRLVLLERIGQVMACEGEYCRAVDRGVIEQALAFLGES